MREYRIKIVEENECVFLFLALYLVGLWFWPRYIYFLYTQISVIWHKRMLKKAIKLRRIEDKNKGWLYYSFASANYATATLFFIDTTTTTTNPQSSQQNRILATRTEQRKVDKNLYFFRRLRRFFYSIQKKKLKWEEKRKEKPV